jgi:hypothetical protein
MENKMMTGRGLTTIVAAAFLLDLGWAFVPATVQGYRGIGGCGALASEGAHYYQGQNAHFH